MEREKYEVYKNYVGTTLDGRYYIDELIGIGGMAVVFGAVDTYINNNRVAIKMLKVDVATDEIMVKRFKNESKAESMLKHRNIVAIHDVSVKGREKYIVMEYVEGITLKNYLKGRNGPLSFDEIICYSKQILRALCVAHENHIIHRDIKPQNIMVLQNGLIKVMDFGIAKLPNAETVTVTDKAIGTVYYMSPEQARGKKIDSRSDIYSFGAMLYELATGELPFTGETPLSVILKQINDDPIPPREINPEIPVGLEQIILCAMSKNPAERFQSAELMLNFIRQLQKEKDIKFDVLPCRNWLSNFMSHTRRIFGINKKK
ncbi:MAG: serine/threonine protein kinase [Clostridia bacterium]|nr:serine/threonine protein kinase [Clostridia bacterium]